MKWNIAPFFFLRVLPGFRVLYQVVEKVELFQQPAYEIAGIKQLCTISLKSEVYFDKTDHETLPAISCLHPEKLLKNRSRFFNSLLVCFSARSNINARHD